MRLMIEFISGIVSALLARPNRSCTRRQPGARSPAESYAPPANVIGQVISRFLILTLSVFIGAAALLSATAAPSTSASAGTPPLPPVQPMSPAPTTNNFDDILATDPSVTPRLWRYIVLHHSGGNRGSAQSFDQYHREVRGWQGLGYDFVIGNGTGQGDGIIVAGPRWYAQESGAHANSSEYNEHGIGICLVGNFDEKPPTPAQMTALRELLKRLVPRYRINPMNVTGHNMIRRGGSTACPGKYFPLQELRAGLQ
jgi:N-acetylmuramoyl-L-alanine amidase